MKLVQFRVKVSQAGLTLVELLISMALMGFVMLTVSNFVFKGNAQVSSVGARFKEASEIQYLVQDIQTDLHRGAYINPNSFRNRLEYTTYDPSLVGTTSSTDAVKKVYGICYYSSVQTDNTLTDCPLSGAGGTYPYLKLSMDGGATWGSPYRISGFTKYRLTTKNAAGSTVTPMFLYGHPSNDCIDYLDDNGNGVLGSGDSTQYNLNCSTYGTGDSTAVRVTASSKSPTYSTKVILANFNFTTGTGNPEPIRYLPQYIFIAVAPGLVRSDMAAVSPGVKDSQLVQSFSFDNAVNSLWPSGLVVRDLDWDAAHERLIIGNSTLSVLYQTERNGVFINTPLTLSDGNYPPNGVAIEEDGNTLHVWYQDYYRRYNLSSSPPLSPTFGPIYNVTNEWSKWHLAFDPLTRYLYMSVWDTTDSKVKISPFYGNESSSGGLPTGGSKIVLPNTFSNNGMVGGLVIEPKNGDFLVARNQVYANSGSNYIDIYRINRSDNSVTTFSVNLTDLGSSATGTNGGFDMAYDAVLNRLFLADNVSKKIYEVAPVKVISSRS